MGFLHSGSGQNSVHADIAFMTGILKQQAAILIGVVAVRLAMRPVLGTLRGRRLGKRGIRVDAPQTDRSCLAMVWSCMFEVPS